jgi:hypothetical protein
VSVVLLWKHNDRQDFSALIRDLKEQNLIAHGNHPADAHRTDDNCYNIIGQRVSRNAKGIVIHKGKAYMNQ